MNSLPANKRLFTETCGISPSSVSLRLPASPQGEAFHYQAFPSRGRWPVGPDEVDTIPQENVKNQKILENPGGV